MNSDPSACVPYPQAIADIWRHTLRLTHWTVSCRWATDAEMRDHLGVRSCVQPGCLYSTITVPPLDVSRNTSSDQSVDVEQEIVHELLHLWFRSGGKCRRADEQMIDNLATVLVQLSRKIPPPTILHATHEGMVP